LEAIGKAPPLNPETVAAKDVRVVCDSMLHGLCKKLRLHGVDSVVEPFENCAKVAQRDGRVVLTRGASHYVRLRQLVAKGHCLPLRSDQTEEQLDEVNQCRPISPEIPRVLMGVVFWPSAM
jgi:uncharacterized protein with PIN domain